MLQPEQQRAGERRGHADIEAAVAGEIGRVVAVLMQAGSMHQKHRDGGAVLETGSSPGGPRSGRDRRRPPPASRAMRRRWRDRSDRRWAERCRMRTRRRAPARPTPRRRRRGCPGSATALPACAGLRGRSDGVATRPAPGSRVPAALRVTATLSSTASALAGHDLAPGAPVGLLRIDHDTAGRSGHPGWCGGRDVRERSRLERCRQILRDWQPGPVPQARSWT